MATIADAAQWTVDRIFSVLNSVKSNAVQVKAQIDGNDAAIANLSRSLASVPGPPAPSGSKWNPLTEPLRRQNQIRTMYARAVKHFSEYAAKVTAFLQAHGINPSAGLSGLGAAIVIPIALVTGALVAIAFIEWMKSANSVQSRAISLQQSALNALIRRQITPEQYQATIKATEADASAKMPRTDPLGLAAFAEALVPVGLIALGIVALIYLPKMLNPRPRRERVAA